MKNVSSGSQIKVPPPLSPIVCLAERERGGRIQSDVSHPNSATRFFDLTFEYLDVEITKPEGLNSGLLGGAVGV